MKENEEMFDKFFRRAALVLLILLIVTIPFFTIVRKVSYDNYIDTVIEYGSDSEEAQKMAPIEMSMTIYKYNSVLCVISIILQIVYFATKKINENKKGANLKEKLARNWPVLLLAFFMCWTAVGCIQAGMEMDAEIKIKQAKNIDEVPQRIIDIANWSSGDRMANTSDMYQNAKSRAWHGCNNLKDGYFSFLFYATVFLNVIMLGNNADNKKRWILRAFLISSLIMIICNYIGFLSPDTFLNVIYYNRLTFNNSNHYGYYISVVLIMSLCMAITEKNWYFKGLAFINAFLYIPMVILNGTFGSYLGVMFAVIFLLVVMLIRLILRKRIAEFISYAVCALWFLACSCSIVGWYTTGYSKNYIYWNVSTFTFNVGNNTYVYYMNTLSPEQAEEKGLSNVTVNGNKVKWGKDFYKAENKSNTFVYNNFTGLARDAKIMFGFYDKQNEAKSGEVATDNNTFTQEDLQNEMLKLYAKYPKKSGETYEEFVNREQAIEKELHELLVKKDLLDASGNVKSLPTEEELAKSEGVNSKSGLTEEVSKTGSGRGEVWIRSLDLMNQRPWFGWGLENLLNEFYQQYGISEGRTHNLILQMGGCTGIPGILMYLVATIAIFLKVVFDVKLRKFDKKGKIVVAITFILITILTNFLVSSITDKLLINGLASVIVLAILYAFVFIKSIRFRIMDWNEFELIGSGVFVSYMISSLFGNSAFYTSPYFMIFLGMLAYEAMNKTPRFVTEQAQEPVAKSETKEVVAETKKVVVQEKKKPAKKVRKK